MSIKLLRRACENLRDAYIHFDVSRAEFEYDQGRRDRMENAKRELVFQIDRLATQITLSMPEEADQVICEYFKRRDPITRTICDHLSHCEPYASRIQLYFNLSMIN